MMAEAFKLADEAACLRGDVGALLEVVGAGVES
jgi:hypothetical protein